MQSYKLNRTLLHGQEQLDFYAGPLPDQEEANHTVDRALDGHFSLSCLRHDVTASFGEEQVGCHTLSRQYMVCGDIEARWY